MKTETKLTPNTNSIRYELIRSIINFSIKEGMFSTEDQFESDLIKLIVNNLSFKIDDLNCSVKEKLKQIDVKFKEEDGSENEFNFKIEIKLETVTNF